MSMEMERTVLPSQSLARMLEWDHTGHLLPSGFVMWFK